MFSKIKEAKAIKFTKDDFSEILKSSIPLIMLLVLVIFFQIVSHGRLLSKQNMMALLNSMYSILLGATGVAFLMAQGNLDFSLGAIVGLSAALAGYSSWINPFLSIVVAILVGVVCGLINGLIHAKLKVASIITTLSTAYIFRGTQATLISKGAVSVPPSLMKLENINLKMMIIVIVVVIGAVLYNKTVLGKYSKAIGSNAVASSQAGIKVDKMKIACFILAGAVAGVVGFFNLVRAASASANTGAGFEFDVLLALLLGGMPISGGPIARFRSVIIGSLIMTILSNGMILWGLDMVLQQLVRGCIFLFSVTLSFDRRNNSIIE